MTIGLGKTRRGGKGTSRGRRTPGPFKPRSITRKYLDGLLREAVLLRDRRCLRCGSDAQSGRVMQAAHIYGKGAHPGMRYDLLNVICLCKNCHFWWHRMGFGREASVNGPVRQWCLEALGEHRMATLDVRSSTGHGKLDPMGTAILLQHEIDRHRMQGFT